MADEFVMPKLGLTMESGTIVGWLVEDGAVVEPGQPVLVIETDKVESEVEATRSGRLRRVGEVGLEYPCGAPIGWLLEPGEELPVMTGVGAGTAHAAPSAVPAPSGDAERPAPGPAAAVTGTGGRLLASPNARRVAAARGIDLRTINGTGPGGRITSEDVPARPPAVSAGLPGPQTVPSGPHAAPAGSHGRLATAAARNLADLLGIDLAAVLPTGVDPRVTREDVAAHVRTLLAHAVPAPSPAGSPAPRASADRSSTLSRPLQDPSSVLPLTGMRGTIAERMSASLQTMAQLTLTMDVDMDGVIADRAARRDRAGPDGPIPGFTDYVVAATAVALGRHPVVNSQVTDGGVALLPRINVGLAVAIEGGLIVPVIHDTPSLGLDELAVVTARLADAARNGKLTLPELEGGTFSVTTLGMFGVDGFTPIVNAPNTAILGVGRLRDDVAWTDGGAPIKARRLTLSLTWDHRAFDGAPAAEFARSIKSNLESYGPA